MCPSAAFARFFFLLIMRQLLFSFLLLLGMLPAVAQQRFFEQTEVTMTGDTLEFVRFSDKVALVYTAALWQNNAQQYAELLEAQETYADFGLVVMELYSAEMSDLDYYEHEPAFLFNRSEYPPCRFTFPLFVDYNPCPLFRFLVDNTRPENYVLPSETAGPLAPTKPLHKWIVNRQGEVVKCFHPEVPMTDVIAALKEVL